MGVDGALFKKIMPNQPAQAQIITDTDRTLNLKTNYIDKENR